MFNSIEIPADAVMLFNIVKLKPGKSIEDIELGLGEMCNVVKETYGDEKGGFIAGQVFKYSGFISEVGSVNSEGQEEDHCVIVTYWKSFAQHEKSHKDAIFLEKFQAVADFCTETKELGYELLWQGTPEILH